MWTSSKGSRWEILQDDVDTPLGTPSKEQADVSNQQKSKRRRRKNRKKNDKASVGMESDSNITMAVAAMPKGLALRDGNAGITTSSIGTNLKKNGQSKTAIDTLFNREEANPSSSPSSSSSSSPKIPALKQDLYIHPTTEKYFSTGKHCPANNHHLPSLDPLVKQASRIELMEEICSIRTTLGVHEGQMASPIRANNVIDQTDLPSSFECDRDAASLVSEIPLDLQSTPARVLTTVTGKIISMSPEDKGVEDMLDDVERIVSELQVSTVGVNEASEKRKKNVRGGRTTTYTCLAITVATLYLSLAVFSGLLAHWLKKMVITVTGIYVGEGGNTEVQQKMKPLALDREAHFVRRKGFDSSIRDPPVPAVLSDDASANDGIKPGSEKCEGDEFGYDELGREEVKGRSFTSWPIDKRGLDFLEKPLEIHRKGMDFLHEEKSVEAPNDIVQWIEVRQSGSACFQPIGVLSPNFEVAHRRSGCAVDLEMVLRDYESDDEIKAEIQPIKSNDGVSYRFPYRPGSGPRPSFLPSDSTAIFANDSPNETSPSTTLDVQRMLLNAQIHAKTKTSLNSGVAVEETKRMLRFLAATHVREQLIYFARQPKRVKIELSVPKLALLEDQE
jgi:hypothetical protein